MQLKITKAIVFINQSHNYLVIDIINTFIKANKKAILFTGYKVNNSIGFKVKKNKSYSNKNIISRITSWLIYFFQVTFKLFFNNKNCYLIIFTNPPFMYLSGYILNKLFNVNYSIVIYDLYPNILADSNVIKKTNIIYRIWAKINTCSFNNAHCLFTISEAMKKQIEQYTNKSVIIMPLWGSNIKNEKDVNYYHDKIKIIYAGNIGLTHGKDTLVAFTNEINRKQISLKIIAKKEQHKYFDKITPINNYFLLLAQQPEEEYIKQLNSSNIGLVISGESASNNSLPSKLFNYISSGLCVLCFTEQNSYLYNFINENCIGKAFTHHQIEEAVLWLDDMNKQPEAIILFCKNSLELSKNYTFSNANIILENIKNV